MSWTFPKDGPLPPVERPARGLMLGIYFLLFLVLFPLWGLPLYFHLAFLRPHPLKVQYDQIEVGMTLAEVEEILGPGTPVENVPENRDGPIVTGDALFLWEEPRSGVRIHMGFLKGKVLGTDYFQPEP